MNSLLDAGEALWREKCGDCELPRVIPPVFSDLENTAPMLNSEIFSEIAG